jgi:beta-1,4-mannosyltransferase
VHELDVTVPDDNSRALVVLESFGPPHGRNNPYFLLLLESFPPTVEVRYFSWRAALVGHFDVFHLHWPEVVLRGRTPARSAVRLVLFIVLLLRLRVQRKGLVRTLHNLAPHEPVSRLQGAVMRMADRATTVWVTLSERIVPPTPAPTVVALHGHFRDWFAETGPTEPVPGRLLFCGRVRRYKGLDRLLASFADLRDDSASLHIVGRTEDPELAAELAAAAAADPRISAIDDFVPDEVLAREIRESEVIVLPFVEMTNSSSLLLALSLDRPVLVPTLPVTDEVAAEVGPGWVQLYDGALEAATLEGALEAVRPRGRTARPDLSRREWAPIGLAHAEAFELARQRARTRRGRRR